MSISVRIYKPSKTTMQSGHGKAKQWVLEPDLVSARIAEPLMGWQSSQDTNNQIKLKFDSHEQAISFANKKGWFYTLEGEQKRKMPKSSYMDNFK